MMTREVGHSGYGEASIVMAILHSNNNFSNALLAAITIPLKSFRGISEVDLYLLQLTPFH